MNKKSLVGIVVGLMMATSTVYFVETLVYITSSHCGVIYRQNHNTYEYYKEE